MQIRTLHDVATDRYFSFQIKEGETLLAGYLGCWDKKPTKKQLIEAVKNKKKGDKTNEPIFREESNGQLCITI